AGQLDNLDMSSQIHRDKMTGIRRRVAMSHDRIGLEGAWSAIVQIIQGGINPRERELPQEDQREGQHHANAQCEDGAFSRGACARWRTAGSMCLLVRLPPCRARGLNDNQGFDLCVWAEWSMTDRATWEGLWYV